MKYLLVLLVVGVGVWLWVSSRRSRRADPGPAAKPEATKSAKAAAPATMIGCAHCGVHLPADDALRDAAGRPFCSDSHRLAGPRHE